MHLLYVEDDPRDIELAMVALAKSRVQVGFMAVPDESHALDYLLCSGEYANRTPGNPAVIFLDLKLEDVCGSDLIVTIRENEALRHIPIVMFTSSENAKDIKNCYRLGANAYMLKPVEFADFASRFIRSVHFWTEINISPYSG